MHVLLLKALALMASVGLMAGSGAGNIAAPVVPAEDDTLLPVEEEEDATRTVVGACEYHAAGGSGQYQFRCGGVHFVFRGEDEEALDDLLAVLPDLTPKEIAELLKSEDAPAGIKHMNFYGPMSPGQLKKGEAAPVEDDEDTSTPDEEPTDTPDEDEVAGKGKPPSPGQLKKSQQAPANQGGNGGGNGGKGGKK